MVSCALKPPVIQSNRTDLTHVLWIYAHASKMFPEYWYIWILLPIGMITHLYIVNKRPLKKPKEVSAVQSENELWLDKAWHGIHFLLTGSEIYIEFVGRGVRFFEPLSGLQGPSI